MTVQIQQQALQIVNMKKLKAFAEAKLKPDSTLRSIILSEPDELSMAEAVPKFKIYLRLFDKEQG